MEAFTEKYSSVPFRYRASLARDEKIVGNAIVHHSMHTFGSIHPEPYSHSIAVALAQVKLQPLLDLGWTIESLVVNGYHSKDA